MKVTLTSQNRALEKQKKSLFAAHIKGLRPNQKQNICVSNKLKYQFNNFDQLEILKGSQIKQKGNVKHFEILKQKCKILNTKKIVQREGYRPNKQLSTQSYGKNDYRIHNNPQIYEDRIKASLNELKSIKIGDVSHSTKANSLQKSRASVDSSGVCCNLIETQKQKKVVNVQEKENLSSNTVLKVQAHKQNKKKRISKITSPQISKLTRIILLDWMFQLSAQIQLPKQALYNSIDYIDKFITETQVKKSQYQQVGLACLFLATKLQMSSHPRIQIFLEAMDNQLDRQVLIETERKIVNILRFRLNPPTLHQYMTVALLTIKTFRSEYKNIGWVNQLPIVQKESQIYRKINWIMDGVIIQGALTHKYGKDQLCLSILYISMVSNFKNNKRFSQKSPQKIKPNNPARYESTVQSEFSYKSIQISPSQFEQEQKFNVAYECFLRYATTSNKSLSDLQSCVQDLEKWRNSSCDCIDENSEYHQQLKRLALQK